MRRRSLLQTGALALLIAQAGGGQSSADDAVRQALEARGLGADALGLLENVLAHDDIPEPLGLGGASMRYLRQPMATPEISELLDLPSPWISRAPPLGWAPPDDLAEPVRLFVGKIVEGVAAAQARLNAAVPETCCDRDAMLAEIASAARAAPAFEPLVEAMDLGGFDDTVREVFSIERSVREMLAAATEGEGDELAAALASMPGRRFASPIGTVVLATSEANQHAAPVGLLIDTGGDDVYDVAAMASRGPMVIVDLAGNDRYQNDAVAVFTLQLRLDLAGDDSYESADGGQAAALGGISLVHDLAGDDRYSAALFAQGAAIGGFAALIDDAGNDRYRIGTRGQGFGGPLGFGGLIDRAGNDEYLAKDGLADPYGRSGGTLSYAQGVGSGYRSRLAGGVGLLRDMAGDDRYDSQMFSQGVGYFHGIGALDDRSGSDAYYGTRYGQGMGAHAGVGLLHDGGGNDGYWLSIGVGQGMGLDAAVGVLDDAGGDDRYQSATLAQGASTHNGFGWLRDRAGADVYALDNPGEGWGRGHPGRGLPALGFLTDRGGGAGFVLGGAALTEMAPAAYGGPLADRALDLPTPAVLACPVHGDDPYAYAEGDPVIDWLGKSAPLLGRREGESVAFYSRMWASLPDSAPRLLRGVPAGDITLAGNLETLLRCYLDEADDGDRSRLQSHLMNAVLDGSAQSSIALAKLRATPPGANESLPIVRNALSSTRCATRAGGLALARETAVADPSANETLRDLARVGMADSCWEAKAAALRLWYAAAGDAAPPPGEFAGSLPPLVRQAAIQPIP